MTNEGVSLTKLITTGKLKSYLHLQQWLLASAVIVAYLAQIGFVHQDLSTNNVVIDPAVKTKRVFVTLNRDQAFSIEVAAPPRFIDFDRVQRLSSADMDGLEPWTRAADSTELGWEPLGLEIGSEPFGKKSFDFQREWIPFTRRDDQFPYLTSRSRS